MSKKMLMTLAIAGLVTGCSSMNSEKPADKTAEAKNGCGANGCKGHKTDKAKNCCKSAEKKKECKAKSDKGSNGCGANGCGSNGCGS